MIKSKNGGFIFLVFLLVFLLCGCSTQSNQNHDSGTPNSTPESLEMKLVWNVSSVGIPFMDLSPSGNLGAAIDWNSHRIYLVKPDGSSVSFDIKEDDPVGPTIAGVAVLNGKAYVLGDYADFSGVRIYSWIGKAGEITGSGGAADGITRSPNGVYLCYLITDSPTSQVLVCNGLETELEATDYSINAVSDTGVVVLREELADKSIVIKNGVRLLTLNTSNVIPYEDKLIVNENDTLKILSLDGEFLASREKTGFSMTTLLRWTLIPTEHYLFRHEPLGDTHVFIWNLTEVRTLSGFPYFANENFVVTAKDGVIYCYSLSDFHEVFRVEVPGDSLGYIRLSDNGDVMLISGETGNFWLYAALENNGKN